jgi:O-antigen/teichoic acid export membrane protein
MIRGLLRDAFASDFLRKIAETYTARILWIAIGLVTTVIVARVLGPTGRGYYAVAMTVGAVGVQLGNLGLHSSNTYFIVRNRELLPTLIANSLLVSFFFGCLGSSLVWGVFSLWPALAPLRGGMLALALSWIPVGLAYLLLENLLIGTNDIRAYNTVELGNRILSVALVGLIILLGIVTPENLFLAALTALLLSCVWMLRRLGIGSRSLPSPSMRLFREHIRYGAKAYVGALLAFLVLRLDLLIIQYLMGPKHVGYYSVAVAMVDLLYTLPVIVGMILFPQLTGMENDQSRWGRARGVSLWVGALMVLLAFAVSLLARPLVWLLYGRAFLPAAPVVVWLMPGIVMLSVNTIFMNFFASIGMPSISVYSPGAAALLNVILNLHLIPRFGIVGAAIASVAAYGLMLALSVAYLHSRGFPLTTRGNCGVA